MQRTIVAHQAQESLASVAGQVFALYINMLQHRLDDRRLATWRSRECAPLKLYCFASRSKFMAIATSWHTREGPPAW